MARVEIYSKTFCPFCIRAAHLLATKGVKPETYNVDGGGPRRDEMIARANGRTTVPQIFIDGRHVGGCDDLFSLDRSGALDRMLAA